MSLRSTPRIVLVLAGVLAAGCASVPAGPRSRTLTPPGDTGALDPQAPFLFPFLKAHLRDGRVYVLSDWSVDEARRTVQGTGEVHSARREVLERGALTLALDEVLLFETNRRVTSPAIAPLAIVSGISAGVTAYCMANPKACFGSCPTFYVSDGAQELLQAEGFSDSVAPSLEARDLDALPRARPAGRELAVRMTNEALETHVVRYVNVLAARRPPGGRVFADSDGRLWAAHGPAAPVECRAAEGDCGELLRAHDGRERFSTTDGHDLAAREIVELRFPEVPGARQGLVIGARQTLLGTYLFYQTLSYMGREAGTWLARVERGEARVKRRARALRDVLGGIEVQATGADGRFRRVAEIHETGPLASDLKVVVLPPGTPRGGRVRLRLTRGHWRLDSVALVSLGEPVTPERLRPSSVRAGGDARQPESLWPLTTLPGDEYTLRYRLPPEPEEFELFLETRGYYLEWMRDEWLREEDAARLAALLRHPRRALRELAPAYRALEPRLEEAFWRSRYVRPTSPRS